MSRFGFSLQTAPSGHVIGPCPKVLGKLRSGVGESLKSVSVGVVGGCFEGKSLLSLRAVTANAEGDHRPAGLRGPRPAADWPLAACWGYSRERQTRLQTSHGGGGGGSRCRRPGRVSNSKEQRKAAASRTCSCPHLSPALLVSDGNMSFPTFSLLRSTRAGLWGLKEP